MVHESLVYTTEINNSQIKASTTKILHSHRNLFYRNDALPDKLFPEYRIKIKPNHETIWFLISHLFLASYVRTISKKIRIILTVIDGKLIHFCFSYFQDKALSRKHSSSFFCCLQSNPRKF